MQHNNEIDEKNEIQHSFGDPDFIMSAVNFYIKDNPPATFSALLDMLNVLKQSHHQMVQGGTLGFFDVLMVAIKIMPFVLYGCTNYYVSSELKHMCLSSHMPQMVACANEVGIEYVNYMNDLFSKIPQHHREAIEELGAQNGFNFSAAMSVPNPL